MPGARSRGARCIRVPRRCLQGGLAQGMPGAKGAHKSAERNSRAAVLLSASRSEAVKLAVTRPARRLCAVGGCGSSRPLEPSSVKVAACPRNHLYRTGRLLRDGGPFRVGGATACDHVRDLSSSLSWRPRTLSICGENSRWREPPQLAYATASNSNLRLLQASAI